MERATEDDFLDFCQPQQSQISVCKIYDRIIDDIYYLIPVYTGGFLKKLKRIRNKQTKKVDSWKT